jgi:N-acetylglucosamine-6-phosphate deacetylase
MAPEILITAPRVVPGAGEPAILEPGYVLVADGRVAEVAGGRPPRFPDRALGSGYLVPGLIDLQVNGYFGVNLAEVEAAGWARVARRLPETGATAFLPTSVTAPVAELAGALRHAAVLAEQPAAGARVLGVHLEGPFLAPGRAGAHRRDLIVPPSPATVAALLTAGAGVLRVVTLAPEVAGGLVTDASAAAGMPPGRYRLGPEPVEVRADDDRAPRLADGTLAGSVLGMDRAVANIVAAGVGLAEAAAAATRVPADLIGRPDPGRLTPGAAADLAWLGDDLRARAARVAGEQVYPPPTARGAPCAGPPGPVGGSPADPR